MKRASIMAALIAVLSIFAMPQAAWAGICSPDRLCFFNENSGNGQRWMTHDMSQVHDNVYYAATTMEVKNNADSVINRDDTCDARVVDDRGIYPDDWHDIPNNGVTYNLISTVDNENDHHTPVNCN